MLNIITIALFLPTSIAAVALPAPQYNGSGTTGNSGTQPYAIENSITLYQSALFRLNGTGTSQCHLATGNVKIESGRCYNLSTSGVTVSRVAEGNCVLQLFYNSDTCYGDNYAYTVDPGSGDSDCYAGQARSGIWTCG